MTAAGEEDRRVCGPLMSARGDEADYLKYLRKGHAHYRAHRRRREPACPESRRLHAEYVATFRGGASYKRTSGREPRSVREVAA